MPAAAVIPAPIAYINVVAVKKLVADSRGGSNGPQKCEHCCVRPFLLDTASALHCVGAGARSFTLNKLECSKQAVA